MGKRLVDDVPRTDGGDAATPLAPACGEAIEAQTVVIGLRSKKLAPDSFVPKPDLEEKTEISAPPNKRPLTTLPAPRSTGRRLLSVATRPASAPRIVVVPPVVAVVTPPTVVVPPARSRPPVEPGVVNKVGDATLVSNPPPPPPSAVADGGRETSDPNECVTPLPSPIGIADGTHQGAGEPDHSATPAPLVIAATTHRRGSEPTDIVAPLPSPSLTSRASSTPLVIVEPGLADPEPAIVRTGADRRSWIVAGAMGAAAVVAVVLFIVIGFSSSGMAREPRPARRLPIATMPREVVPPAPTAPVNPPPPERAVHTEAPQEPTPPSDVAAQVPASPPPAETRIPPEDAVSAPADEPRRTPRSRTRDR